MPSFGRAPLALLLFGLVALIGLIVLAGTDSLHDDAVRSLLISTTTSCVVGAGALSIPSHAHPAAAAAAVPVVDEPAAPPLVEVPTLTGTAMSGTTTATFIPPGA